MALKLGVAGGTNVRLSRGRTTSHRRYRGRGRGNVLVLPGVSAPVARDQRNSSRQRGTAASGGAARSAGGV